MAERRRAEILRLKRLQAEPPEHELEKLYMWVDQIPLSRPKKNLARDFSDGVLTAELIHFVSGKRRLVYLHDYHKADSIEGKASNWQMLNRKVFLKLNLDLTPESIRAIARCTPLVMENFLMVLREKLDLYLVHHHVFHTDYEDDIAAVAQLDSRPVVPHSKGTPRRRQAHSQTSDFHVQQQTPYSPSWLENPEVRVSRRQHHGEMVSRELLLDKEAVLAERNQAVQMLQTKIEKLENWCELKDRRIDDMSNTLERMSRELDYQRQRQMEVQHGPVHLKRRKMLNIT